MFFRISFALLLSGILFSDMTARFAPSDDAGSSETRGHRTNQTDDDTGPSRSGYIIASS